MLNLDTVLAAIGSTEVSDFNDLCKGLGADCPEKGERAGWRELFSLLDEAEHNGLVEITRAGRTLETVILTEAGAAMVRSKLDARRGLFREGV